MEQTEVMDQAGTMLSPQVGSGTCSCGHPDRKCTCGGAAGSHLDGDGMMAYSYVYALGKVESRFSSLSVEKEFAQAMAQAETNGLTDRQALHIVLSEPQNRYLVRQLCYVLAIEGLETYILHPSDPMDFGLLVEAVRPLDDPEEQKFDLVIGVRGPVAPPEMCNGLMIPIVAYDQIYSFTKKSFVDSIPQPPTITNERQFRLTAGELFDTIIQMADNAGATDEHRALNYLLVRYPAIYVRAAEAHEQNSSLTGVEVRHSRLSGVRRIVEVIFSYTNRNTDVTEKYFVRVDVTERWPFLVTKLSPFYEH